MGGDGVTHSVLGSSGHLWEHLSVTRPPYPLELGAQFRPLVFKDFTLASGADIVYLIS